jgi:hypothetical protein
MTGLAKWQPRQARLNDENRSLDAKQLDEGIGNGWGMGRSN